MEPNPYESPKVDQPLSRVQIVKRSLGLATILLLTPPTTAIAAFASCAAGRFLSFGSLVVFLGPMFVLVGLVGWAAYVRQQQGDNTTAKRSCIRALVATPLFVGLATAVGFALGAMTYMAIGPGDDFIRGEWAVMAVFWVPPAATLLIMLLVAWRYR